MADNSLDYVVDLIFNDPSGEPSPGTMVCYKYEANAIEGAIKWMLRPTHIGNEGEYAGKTTVFDSDSVLEAHTAIVKYKGGQVATLRRLVHKHTRQVVITIDYTEPTPKQDIRNDH